MAVGSNQGTVYIGDQGKELATVLGGNMSVPAVLQNADKKKKAAEDRKNALKQMQDFRPEETWHYYSGQMNNKWDEWMREGADIMANKDINDPWKSTDPAALDWRLKGSSLMAENQNINQAKGWWDKTTEDIRNNPDKYEDGFKNSVHGFGHSYTFDEIAGGKFKYPEPKTKKPITDTYKMTGQIIKQAREQYNTEDLTDDLLLNVARDVIGNPEYNQGANGGYVGQLKEIYSAIPDKLREYYDNIAVNSGATDGFTFFTGQYIGSRHEGKRMNLLQKMQEMANVIPKTSSSIEDKSGVTTTSKKVGNTDTQRQEIAEMITLGYPGQVQRDVKNGLYGSMALSPDENRKEAVEYYKDKIDFGSEFSVRREGSGMSEQELTQSTDLWYQNLTSRQGAARNAALSKLSGVKMPDGTKITYRPDTGGSAGVAGDNITVTFTGPVRNIEKYVSVENEQLQETKREYQGREQEVIEFTTSIGLNEYTEEFWKDLYGRAIKEGNQPIRRDFRKERVPLDQATPDMDPSEVQINTIDDAIKFYKNGRS